MLWLQQQQQQQNIIEFTYPPGFVHVPTTTI